MTNDAERVSDIVAVEAVERIWDFLAPLRQREKGMEISAVFIGRMKELEASDQSARDLLNEQDDIIEAQSKALAEARAGWKLVPVKPTSEMLNAAIDVDSFKLGDISPLGFRISPQMLFEECYAAMLAACPKGEPR